MSSFQIVVYKSGAVVQSQVLSELLEVGRVDPRLNDPKPIAIWRCDRRLRLVVAESNQVAIPRCWFNVVATDDNGFAITNLHSSRSITLSRDAPIESGQSRRFSNHALLELDFGIVLRVEAYADSNAYRTLESILPTPGEATNLVTPKPMRDFAASDAAEFTKLLRIALQVVQQAAGSDAFLQAAVVAAAEIVDLDRAVLVLRKDAQEAEQIAMECNLADGWCTVAEHWKGNRPAQGQRISTSLFRRAMQSCATVIHNSLGHHGDGTQDLGVNSLQSVECAVASPILNREREVIGMLYGDRSTRILSHSAEVIGDIEATLVEILASSVAGGIARRAEEKLRHTLSGFFSSKVANQLANDPTLMAGQDAEVSVLFCDVRGFSSVTEKLGPQKAIAWINDVMSELSGCVLERDGVLVDYVGDELLAMWGAPGKQPDHAALAIDTARAMLEKIETLRLRWADILPHRFGAGIGINSGPARVGNVGSRQKFKYGPLGNTVNMGSRLQTATKQIGINCVASYETVRAANQIAASRRIAKLNVVGIEQPIDVYEIVLEASDKWKSMTERYQEALEDFENQRFSEAARTIGALLPEHPGDLPCRKLLARVLIEMDEPTANFNGVWNLSIK